MSLLTKIPNYQQVMLLRGLHSFPSLRIYCLVMLSGEKCMLVNSPSCMDLPPEGKKNLWSAQVTVLHVSEE